VHKIRGYYDFVWSDDANASLKSSASFNDEVETLPKSLQVALFEEMHSAILAKVPILTPLPSRAVFALAKYWVRQIFLPDDEIVQEGEMIKALYFIVRGEVGVTLNMQLGMRSLRLVDLGSGDFFGEECRKGATGGIGAMATERFAWNVQSIGYSELLVIPVEMFVQVAAEHESINKHVNPVLQKEERRRLIKQRWKMAVARIILINRWKTKSKPSMSRNMNLLRQHTVGSMALGALKSKTASSKTASASSKLLATVRRTSANSLSTALKKASGAKKVAPEEDVKEERRRSSQIFCMD
jgi:CRP-like cAMP-binding protein